jgi:hypothetical protein
VDFFVSARNQLGHDAQERLRRSLVIRLEMGHQLAKHRHAGSTGIRKELGDIKVVLLAAISVAVCECCRLGNFIDVVFVDEETDEQEQFLEIGDDCDETFVVRDLVLVDCAKGHGEGLDGVEDDLKTAGFVEAIEEEGLQQFFLRLAMGVWIVAYR